MPPPIQCILHHSSKRSLPFIPLIRCLPRVIHVFLEFTDSISCFLALKFSDNTGLKQQLECWLTIIPSTHHTVDKFGHIALCKDIVQQVAAIMDHVELVGWVVVVEAEWLVRPLRPGAFSCPLGCSACHMEVQIGLERVIMRISLKSKEFYSHIRNQPVRPLRQP